MSISFGGQITVKELRSFLAEAKAGSKDRVYFEKDTMTIYDPRGMAKARLHHTHGPVPLDDDEGKTEDS